MEDKKEITLPLSRKQKRVLETIQEEAEGTYKILTDKFFDIVINSDDPEGLEVLEAKKRINAQWLMFCHRRKLINGALEQFAIFSDKVIEQYKELKAAE